MTRVYYSNLPPEAQEAIRKLTGLGAQELEGKQMKLTETKTTKISKPKEPEHYPPWQWGLGCFSGVLLGLAICLAVIAIIESC